MRKHQSMWLLVALSLLLAACGSSGTPETETSTITTQAVDVEYELAPRFAAYQRGDINADGRVNTADLRILSEVLATGDVSELSDYRRYQADFTCDGILNNEDLREIQNRAANSKEPAEIQICPNIEVLIDDEVVVLVSNIGDLPINGFQVTSSAGIDISLIPTIYQTATPTTFVYDINIAEGVTEGSISIEGNRLDFEVDVALGNIAEIVSSRPELSVLLNAVLEAGLADALSGDDELTVFAPNNEAFANFLDENGFDDLEEAISALGIELVSELLQFHVVPSTLTAADLLAQINANGGNTILLETLTGGGLTVSLVDGNVVLQDDNVVVEANIDANNGIIHVIDGVLTYFEDPLKVGTITLGETVSGVLETTDSYDLFEVDDGIFVRDYFDAYTLEGVEIGQTVTITGNSAELGDVFLVLLDTETGEFIDSSFGQLTFEITRDTIDRIDVLAEFIGDLGAYTLTATLATGSSTIADIAIATPDLSSLVDALNTDQVTLLSDPTQSLTVLAPVNSAFAAASDLLGTLTPEQIATVINYHVLVGEFFAADVVALDGQTLPNSDITVSVINNDVFLQGAGNVVPVQIIQTDIDASNGVIHKLDGILLPAGIEPPPTIAELATQDTDLSELVGALTAEQAALLGDREQTLTVLAPVNAAFAAIGDVLGTLSAEQVEAVINYHVLAGEFLAADVIALDGQTLPNSDITVSVIDGNVFLQGAGNDAPIQIIETDIDASNGVIHKLNGVLLPSGLATGEATISGRVFNDANQNDTQDAGEAGLENFTVSAFIDTNANGNLDTDEVPFSATTDADGNYTIIGLDANATYAVTQQLPFGWRNVVASDAPGIVTQIIGGGTTDIAEYPFKIALITDPSDPLGSYYGCGASLISDRWVLSAAHCFEDVPPQETVDQGLFVLLSSSTLEPGQGQTVQVAEVINHPSYQNGNIAAGFDVTLLRLTERVNVPTVPLVTPETRNLVAPGTRGVALGWGTFIKQSGLFPSTQLQEVDVPIISNEDCIPLLGGPESGDNFDTQLCAVRPTGGVDTCQGDSGGMFIVRNATNTGWVQAGVTSYGGDCSAPNDPGVYARMDTLTPWIFENASEAGGTVTVDLSATPNATANFGNVSTLNPQEDLGDLFFLNDFDIEPTSIRDVPVGEPLTFSWNISNTAANTVCTLSYVTSTETEEDGQLIIDLGTEETAIGTVDPCVPGDNTADFAGFDQAGNYNVTLTVTGDNKTRTRTLYLTVQ